MISCACWRAFTPRLRGSCSETRSVRQRCEAKHSWAILIAVYVGGDGRKALSTPCFGASKWSSLCDDGTQSFAYYFHWISSTTHATGMPSFGFFWNNFGFVHLVHGKFAPVEGRIPQHDFFVSATWQNLSRVRTVLEQHQNFWNLPSTKVNSGHTGEGFLPAQSCVGNVFWPFYPVSLGRRTMRMLICAFSLLILKLFSRFRLHKIWGSSFGLEQIHQRQ